MLAAGEFIVRESQLKGIKMKPSLFIGSSKESLDIAYALQENLESVAEVTVWDQGIFALSQPTISSLIKALDKSKFGAFILSPDDVTKIRGSEYQTARDNIVFELGLFIGRLSLERTFFVIPGNSMDMHLPTDLLGLTPTVFDANRQDGNIRAALGPASNQIRKALLNLESPRFDNELYEKFSKLLTNAKETLISAIATSDKSNEFPNKNELYNENVYSLNNMAKAANINTPDLFILGIDAIGGLLYKPGKKAMSWEQKNIENEIIKLEIMLKEWEKIL
ncbi:hypothetical protein BuS5_03955 (plasmid) [Desulfosarcina sp. BuS5]|nr:hypothetical protein BuS5_03955 [Desulfosarcina sp. BuS5]